MGNKNNSAGTRRLDDIRRVEGRAQVQSQQGLSEGLLTDEMHDNFRD